MGEQRIRTRCACGWESTGSLEVVVAATIDHGRRVHNMLGTREQVLEQAEILPPDDEVPGTVTRGPAGA
jgi:hypothetical protein